MEDLGLDFVIMSPEMLIPLPAPKQDYPQATLYIVASHWASDGEYGSYEIPFTSLIDAQRQFHDDLREEQDGGSIDSWRQKSQFVEEETQNSYECYLDGEYCENFFVADGPLLYGKCGWSLAGKKYARGLQRAG